MSVLLSPYCLALVALTTPSYLLSLCVYMFSDSTHRLPLLRSLKTTLKSLPA